MAAHVNSSAAGGSKREDLNTCHNIRTFVLYSFRMGGGAKKQERELQEVSADFDLN